MRIIYDEIFSRKVKKTEKEKNYFKFNLKKASNVGKLYLLPKIHKRLSNVLGHLLISNCGTPTEKVSEFLDHHLQPVMKEGKSYIKDIANFLDKLKDLCEIPGGAILVAADVVGLYTSIPHSEGLEVLQKQYDKFLHKKVLTEDITKMEDFVSKKIFFLSLIPNFSCKYLELLLVLNLPLPICLYFYGLQ